MDEPIPNVLVVGAGSPVRHIKVDLAEQLRGIGRQQTDDRRQLTAGW